MTYVLMTILLGFLILVHELGHFGAARGLNVPVARFSIGFGPALLKWQKNGIEYRLSVMPLGGYVMLGVTDEKEYLALPLFKRILFSLAGPAANLLLALPLYMILNILVHGFTLSGLFLDPIYQTTVMTGRILAGFQALWSSPEAVSGLVGIIVTGGQYVGLGLNQAISLAIMLTLNLAIFNLLPLPPLDGGKVVFDILHRFGTRVAKLYVPVTVVGLLLIGGLMVYATVMDFMRLLA